MTLSREYLVQSVGSCLGWEVNQTRYLTLLRTLRLLAVSFEKPRWTNKNLIDKQKGQKVRPMYAPVQHVFHLLCSAFKSAPECV